MLFTKYPFFGSRQIVAHLPQSGFSTGHQRFRRLMNIIGPQATYIGPNTGKKHHDPYLLKKLAIRFGTATSLTSPSKQLFALVSDHGLSGPQGFDLAAFKYAGWQLLH